MRKFREARPERNNGPHLTIPVKTRSPIEAFELLRQGNAVDVMGGYFEEQGYIGDDFFMLDKTAKLHKLAELREIERQAGEDILQANRDIITHNQKVQDEIRKQKSAAASGQQTQPAGQQSAGPVS